MFRTVHLSIIRSFSLYTQQWYMSYTFYRQLASKLSVKPSALLVFTSVFRRYRGNEKSVNLDIHQEINSVPHLAW